jgi:hypothetical protein
VLINVLKRGVYVQNRPIFKGMEGINKNISCLSVEDRTDLLLMVRNEVVIPLHGFNGYNANKKVNKLDKCIDYLYSCIGW